MISSKQALARLWPRLFTPDILIYLIPQIKARRIPDYTVLCDRFIPDVIVDLTHETGDYQLPKRLVGRLILSLIPKKILS